MAQPIWNESSKSYSLAEKTDPKDRIDVIIGDDKDASTFQPQVKLSRWDNEVNLSVRLKGDNVGSESVSFEGNRINWEKGDKTVSMYPVASEQEKQDVAPATTNITRYIKNPNAIPLTHCSAMRGFAFNITPTTPTLTHYWSSEDGYGFYGTKWARKEVKPGNELQIFRQPSQSNSDCPVTLTRANEVVVVDLYYPGIKDQDEELLAKMETVINNVLSKYGISLNRPKTLFSGHLLLYNKGLGVYQAGRMTVTKNNAILYLHLKPPLRDGTLSKYLTLGAKLLENTVMPVGGLHELNPNIEINTLANELSEEMAKVFGLQLEEKPLDTYEQIKFDELVRKYSTDEFRERNTIKEEITTQHDPDGAYELEVILEEKPTTNYLEFTVESKNLDFFYQPELTQEEIEAGGMRPEWIVGSYAVYHKFKKDNEVGGKEYRAGKAFHIYRPMIKDANGSWVWGELNIKDNILTVTIPQEFLDNAVYPIIVDPTFGYTTAGGTSEAMGGTTTTYKFWGSLFNCPESGTIQSITYYSGSSMHGVEMFKHSDSSLIINVAPNNTGTDTTWREVSISDVAVTNQDYILGICRGDPGKSGVYFYYDAGSTDQGHTVTWTEDPATASPPTAVPDPATFTHADKKFSIYATYTASGGGGGEIKPTSFMTTNTKFWG
jgi:hypothetical protein